jgi:hypothetical protein
MNYLNSMNHKGASAFHIYQRESGKKIPAIGFSMEEL